MNSFSSASPNMAYINARRIVLASQEFRNMSIQDNPHVDGHTEKRVIHVNISEQMKAGVGRRQAN
eukprot:79985-Pyramimonas_sp.AAC.1